MMAFPNSAGSGLPRTVAPWLACDAHIHVYDPCFPEVDGPALTATPNEATVDDYRRIQQRLGTSRAVIVQPRAYGTDNDCTLNAIAQMGLANARGIGVVTPDVDEDEMERLHAGGIRGVRMTLHAAAGAPTRIEMLAPLAERIAAWGWHLQLHLRADQIASHTAALRTLPCPVVFDHLGRLPPGPEGLAHPAFSTLRELLEESRAWIKLSGAYLNTASGAPYADTHAVARAWIRAAPSRLVWGSDWPHATEGADKPDDALLFDLLAEWAEDEGVRHRVLVDNPAVLYGF